MRIDNLSEHQLENIFNNLNKYVNTNYQPVWTRYVKLGSKIVRIICYSDEFTPLVERVNIRLRIDMLYSKTKEPEIYVFNNEFSVHNPVIYTDNNSRIFNAYDTRNKVQYYGVENLEPEEFIKQGHIFVQQFNKIIKSDNANLVHGAVIGINNNGILFCARGQRGKSTLSVLSMMEGFEYVSDDYLILDLGAGTSMTTVDFFLLSSEGILITTPNLTAILNAYLFLKNAVFRLLSRSFPRKSPGRTIIEEISADPGALQRIYLPTVFEKLKTADPENFERFNRLYRVFRPKLIMNMVEKPKDNLKAQKIKVSCQQYLGLELDHYGVIYKDHLQDIALASRLPIIRYKRESLIPQAIYRIAEKIEQTAPTETSGGEWNPEIEENYQTAEREAENDFEFRAAEIQKMIRSGVLTDSDFLELIRQQQYELKSLRNENRLLRNKLAAAIKQGFKI